MWRRHSRWFRKGGRVVFMVFTHCWLLRRPNHSKFHRIISVVTWYTSWAHRAEPFFPFLVHYIARFYCHTSISTFPSPFKKPPATIFYCLAKPSQGSAFVHVMFLFSSKNIFARLLFAIVRMNHYYWSRGCFHISGPFALFLSFSQHDSWRDKYRFLSPLLLRCFSWKLSKNAPPIWCKSKGIASFIIHWRLAFYSAFFFSFYSPKTHAEGEREINFCLRPKQGNADIHFLWGLPVLGPFQGAVTPRTSAVISPSNSSSLLSCAKHPHQSLGGC